MTVDRFPGSKAQVHPYRRVEGGWCGHVAIHPSLRHGGDGARHNGFGPRGTQGGVEEDRIVVGEGRERDSEETTNRTDDEVVDALRYGAASYKRTSENHDSAVGDATS